MNLPLTRKVTTRLPAPEVVQTRENLSGGILVVTQPGYGPLEYSSVRRAFLFDKSVDRGPVLNRFAEWFPLWGIDIKRVRGTEGAFERSFFTLEWPPQTVSGHGPQTIPKIAEHISLLCDVLEQRRPRLVIFLSCYLWQAVNTPDALRALSGICGSPRGKGRRITDERLAAYVQHWSGGVQMLALPQPSKNTTEKCVRAMAQGVREAFEHCSVPPENVQDPLQESALDFVYIDREKTIRLMAAGLHIQTKRAEAIFDSLENSLWIRDGAGLKLKR